MVLVRCIFRPRVRQGPRCPQLLNELVERGQWSENYWNSDSVTKTVVRVGPTNYVNSGVVNLGVLVMNSGNLGLST